MAIRSVHFQSAGNDLPSPLLAKIRMLSDADFSPVRTTERTRGQSLMSPQSRSAKGNTGLGIPGTHGSSSDASAAGSARKRKASYDLMSPRQRVMNVETSPSPTSSSPPPVFQAFAPSSPRYHGQSAAQPRAKSSDGLFGPSASQKRPSAQPRERPLNLFPYNQPAREEHMASLPLHLHAPRPHSAQDYHGSQYSSSRPASVTPDFQQQQPPSSVLKKKKDNQKKQSTSLASTSLPVEMHHHHHHQQQQHINVPEVAPALANFTPLVVNVGQYDARTKPPFSYAALIGQAIFSTPNRRMSLADIYTHIMTIYPFYRKQDAGWQNSIRHNLSLNECFVKTQRGPDEPGKGCLWSVLSGTEEQFTGGNFYKKGKVPKSAKAIGSGSGGSNSKRNRKAGSVASGTETMSAASADDSYDNLSMNSASFVSNSSQMMMQLQHFQQYQQQQQHQLRQEEEYQQYHQPPQQLYQHHGPSNLRPQRNSRKTYADVNEEEEIFEEEDDNSFDMDQQLEESAQLRNEGPRRDAEHVRVVG